MAAIPSTVEASQELLISELPEQSSLGQDAWRRLRRNRLAVVGLVIIAIFFVTALVSLVWTPYPTWRQALGTTYAGPSLGHPLGLDDYGRDILSRVMGGAAIALAVRAWRSKRPGSSAAPTKAFWSPPCCRSHRPGRRRSQPDLAGASRSRAAARWRSG